MPIRPENKDRYPKDWPQISRAIRDAAGNHCQKCGAPNGETILRFEKFYAVPFGIGAHVYDGETGNLIDARPVQDLQHWKPVKIVLTVAHLDHQPENCDPENLRALCQRCHNAYDAPMRRAGIKERARSKLAVADMFSEARNDAP